MHWIERATDRTVRCRINEGLLWIRWETEAAYSWHVNSAAAATAAAAAANLVTWRKPIVILFSLTEFSFHCWRYTSVKEWRKGVRTFRRLIQLHKDRIRRRNVRHYRRNVCRRNVRAPARDRRNLTSFSIFVVRQYAKRGLRWAS